MACELVHLAFSLYFWCIIFTPFWLQTASVKDKQKKNKVTSPGPYLTCFCTVHAINESTAKDLLCPHWKCSFCSSWNNAWTAIPAAISVASPLWAVWEEETHKTGTRKDEVSIEMPVSSLTSDKILMEAYLESCTEAVKQLLRTLLLLKQVKAT